MDAPDSARRRANSAGARQLAVPAPRDLPQRAHLQSSPPQNLPAGSCSWLVPRGASPSEPGGARSGSEHRPPVQERRGEWESPRALLLLLQTRSPSLLRSPLQAPVAADFMPLVDLRRSCTQAGRARAQVLVQRGKGCPVEFPHACWKACRSEVSVKPSLSEY